MASKERMRNYKNKAKDQDELRRRREEEGIQLRKQKRDEQVSNDLYQIFIFLMCKTTFNP